MAKEVSQLWRVVQAWLDVLPWPPSQRKLAISIGVKPSAVTEWKYGISKPQPENLRALAEMMQSVAGPDVYDRLVEAVNVDQGYLPRPKSDAG